MVSPRTEINIWGDKDKDGITDNIDKCPDVFGSVKNFGCPEKDTDGDGIVDPNDLCPNTKGESSNNGCPIVTDKQVEIVSKAISNLEFETNSAVIIQNSFIGLDMLAILLSEKDDWKLKISGHTDNIGTDEFNMQLSKDRAEAVRNYLVSKGLSYTRFIIEYFGESKPIDTNETETGRQKNRRVEMKFIFE
ncbi:MAG: OmpA family protein [Pseudomonadota bacterium]